MFSKQTPRSKPPPRNLKTLHATLLKGPEHPMVRHKARWLLVRIDFESDIKSAANPEIEINSEIEAKDVFRAIHHVVKSEFGIVGAGILEEIKGMYI